MPRVKLGTGERDDDILACITTYMIKRHTTVPNISKGTGIPKDTIYYYMRNPGMFPVWKLRAVYDFLTVPHEKRAY